ncbi:MAG: hypothetical protein ACTH6N_15655 [Brachybacterium tyrofermentans]
MRRVVLLCGPPGAGKTTAARASGFEVFDRDDAAWTTESQFQAALEELGQRHHVEAVVIRAGATSSARRRWADLVRATHVFLVLEPPEVAAARVRARGRDDMVRTLAGIKRWWSAFDHDDHAPRFSSWELLNEPDDLGLMS